MEKVKESIIVAIAKLFVYRNSLSLFLYLLKWMDENAGQTHQHQHDHCDMSRYNLRRQWHLFYQKNEKNSLYFFSS